MNPFQDYDICVPHSLCSSQILQEMRGLQTAITLTTSSHSPLNLGSSSLQQVLDVHPVKQKPRGEQQDPILCLEIVKYCIRTKMAHYNFR